MKSIIQWSIEHSWLVIGLSLLLLGAGGWTAREMPIDVFPDLTAARLKASLCSRIAPSTDRSASRLCGSVRSATAVGIAVVWVEFDWGTDIFVARQLVSEKLTLVGGTLPPQVERPVLAPVSSIMGEILFFAISSLRRSPTTRRAAR